jgi:S1-C subfamily serine protease
MKRFSPYLGIAVALALGVFIAIFSHSTIVPAPTPIIPITSPTLLVTNPTAATSTQEQTAPVPEKTTATSSPALTKSTPVPAPVTPVAPAPQKINSVPAPTTSSPSDTDALLDASASALRAALVNIICYVPVGSDLHSISGSGVIIDPKGIILTNAHIAEYFLLADRGASCIIRSGSPAADSYTAALIYISPLWIRANADILTQVAPSGTGEYDFALLAITKSATANALPSAFPSLPLAIVPPSSGTSVVIASYGAQFLESNQIQSDLFPTIVFGSVKDIFTFGVNTIDVLALGVSAAAQEGSSGGGVADMSGELVGTITTSTVSGATDTRSLNAITASYIRGEYAGEMGSALDLLLAEPTATAVADFVPQIPVLESILTAHLP